MTGAARAAAAFGALGLVTMAMCACDPTFGIGLASTRALEAGAQASLSSSSFEVAGTYLETGEVYTIDVQLERPDKKHFLVTGANLDMEAVVLGSQAYFRGQAFLAQHMGTDPLSQNIVKAAGNAWWKGSSGLVPALPEFTDATAFKRTFLGSAANSRTDHVSIDGVDTAAFSGPRGDVYIGLTAPYPLVHLHFGSRVSVDGLESVDLKYSNYGRDFGIGAPADVIDFSNLSTLPPIYQVVSVDTSKCTSPCVVSALLKNLGGRTAAKAPSTVTFTMNASATNAVMGSCQAQVSPDVGFNSTTTVSCTISNLNSQSGNAAIVTATVDNPGRG